MKIQRIIPLILQLSDPIERTAALAALAVSKPDVVADQSGGGAVLKVRVAGPARSVGVAHGTED